MRVPQKWLGLPNYPTVGEEAVKPLKNSKLEMLAI
jgi:hypothetical protein